MKKLIYIILLCFPYLHLFANSNQINDTIYKENEIRVYYKSQKNVDSIYIFNKKLKIKERGYIVGNQIKFLDEKNHLTAMGGFFDNNLQGLFLYFKNNKLYKTVTLKNGEEERIALVFDKDGYLDLLYESSVGKHGGLSLLFENHMPKFIRTDKIENINVILGSFSKEGILQSLDFPNNENSEMEEQVEKILKSK